MFRVSLAEPAVLRRQVVARRRWGVGTRVWGRWRGAETPLHQFHPRPPCVRPSLFKVGKKDLPPHPRAAPLGCWNQGATAQSPDEVRTLGRRGRQRGPQCRACRSVRWPEGPAEKHQPVAHGNALALNAAAYRQARQHDHRDRIGHGAPTKVRVAICVVCSGH